MPTDHSGGEDNDIDWNTDDELEIDYFRLHQSSSPVHFMTETSSTADGASSSNSIQRRISDETFASFIDMGYSDDMIARAIEENCGANRKLILETLMNSTESSKSKVIGEENVDELINAVLSYEEAEKLQETEDGDMNFIDDNNNLYSESPNEELNKKKRAYNNEPPRKGRKQKTALTIDDNHIRLPNPMTGFGVPNGYGLMTTHRPVPVPDIASGWPYFYYENVANTTKGVWDKISSHLYHIMPEFVDSIYFCASARKRGYIHNLPIHNRFQLQPPPPYTIQEALPLTKKWWPTWDRRTKLNCLVTCIAPATVANRIRELLENHDRDPPLQVQKEVILECHKWNLVWIGKNKVAPIDMEELLGFPKDYT